MWNNEEFRMAEGAHVVGHQGDSFEIQVTVPTDDDGFLGRECPHCTMTFRIDADDYERLPDNLTLWCVYCGHHSGHSDFMTTQQRERLLRVAEDLGTQIVSRSLHDIFGGLARKSSRGSPVTFSYKPGKPFYPRPLPGIDEERLVRIRTCPGCRVKYAVFSEHRYCPVCGELPAASVAFDALQADTARLDALEAIPSDVKAALREQGVFSRNWVDTIENVVGVVEILASSLFKASVHDADARLRGKGNVFQRLEDMAVLFTDAGFPDVRASLASDTWDRLLSTWAARHVFTHNDGVVDPKYLTRVPRTPLRVGQRLTLDDPTCRRAIEDTTLLCTALTELTS
ncbi:hypothetical protein [Streptomyces sp. NBC_00073]|uniref:hypothetical protein n=1 Tax=Streptomyces sp. NBC_00073 TaxID=2975640 RepID=UPI00324A5AD1